jgi:RHS repeat-associated protein
LPELPADPCQEAQLSRNSRLGEKVDRVCIALEIVLLSAPRHIENRTRSQRGSYGRVLYNWHRYYDPSLGRYISADPIGQAGGVNLYNYAGNNPARFIDPFGLNDSEGPGVVDQVGSFLDQVCEARTSSDPCCQPGSGSPEACEAKKAECRRTAAFDLGGATAELLEGAAPDIGGPPQSALGRFQRARESTERMLDAIKTGLGELLPDGVGGGGSDADQCDSCSEQ